MGKIWDRNIIRSRRSLAVVAGMKKPNDRQKSNDKMKNKTPTKLVYEFQFGLRSNFSTYSGLIHLTYF